MTFKNILHVFTRYMYTSQFSTMSDDYMYYLVYYHDYASLPMPNPKHDDLHLLQL